MKQTVLIPIGIIVAITIVVFSTNISNSVLGSFYEQFTKPNWDEVEKRNIVKNSIPTMLIERSDKGCLISANNFEYILDHQYFVRSQELAKELRYDQENKTLLVSCEDITDEKLKLHVWYATEEALKHSLKYEYFITPFDYEK